MGLKIAPVFVEQAGDKFIVLASDGVWEFISSQEAIDIVNSSLEEGTMKVGVRTLRSAETKRYSSRRRAV